jgi:acyl-[acyl carrier protein]--UDP-N-acetylglucosamine O-acyltransferase
MRIMRIRNANKANKNTNIANNTNITNNTSITNNVNITNNTNITNITKLGSKCHSALAAVVTSSPPNLGGVARR